MGWTVFGLIFFKLIKLFYLFQHIGRKKDLREVSFLYVLNLIIIFKERCSFATFDNVEKFCGPCDDASRSNWLTLHHQWVQSINNLLWRFFTAAFLFRQVDFDFVPLFLRRLLATSGEIVSVSCRFVSFVISLPLQMGYFVFSFLVNRSILCLLLFLFALHCVPKASTRTFTVLCDVLLLFVYKWKWLKISVIEKGAIQLALFCGS